MIKFKVNKVIERKTAKGDPYKTCVTVVDGLEKEISVWPQYSQYTQVVDGAEVTGVLFPSSDGKYTSLKDEAKPKAGGYSTAQMEKLVDKKSQNISDAQGRNEVMWAKYNACELVAHHPAFKDLDMKEVERKIFDLASKIKNSDLAPF